MTNWKKQLKNQQGFTLAELLVSIIIGLLIFITVSSIFTLNQRVLRKTNSKSELTQNARIVLDLMAREIRQANKIVTVLPIDDSDPALIAHELQFEDGHNTSYVQYIKYGLDGGDLTKQTIIYYFDTACGGACPPTDTSLYVYWDDIDAFGPPDIYILDTRIIGENFTDIDFYGNGNINIDLTLQKKGEEVKIKSIINPRNI